MSAMFGAWLVLIAPVAARRTQGIHSHTSEWHININIKLFPCQFETKYGKLDRWVSIMPDTPGALTQVRRFFVNDGWETMFDDKEQLPLPFAPYMMRTREEYAGRVVASSATHGKGHDGCRTEYSPQCVGDEFSVLMATTCPQDKTTEKVLHFNPLKTSTTVCAAREDAIDNSFNGWLNQKAWNQSVDAIDGDGGSHALAVDQCVKISAMDPSHGIDLDELDGLMMGDGVHELAANTSLVDRLSHFATTTGKKVMESLHDTVDDAIEGGKDLYTVAVTGVENRSLDNRTGNITAKWLKRMSLATMVDMCLCCDTKFIDSNETMAAHCRSAYTLGGQNKTDAGKYWSKVAAGSLYNLAQTIGGMLVPFIGGGIVKKGHTDVCQYTCGLRKPLLYEPYQYGRVAKVPGMALKTWLVSIL